MTAATIDSNKKHLALALTAVGATLAAGAAQAAVVTGGPATVDGDTPSYSLPGNITLNSYAGVSTIAPKITLSPDTGAAVTGDPLALNEVIGDGSNWTTMKATVSSEGYYGLRSSDGDYGWVHVTHVSVDDTHPDYLSATFDWAYQDNAGVAIKAGSLDDLTPPQTGGNTGGTVPEPGGLALVAAGLVAAAVARRRSR